MMFFCSSIPKYPFPGATAPWLFEDLSLKIYSDFQIRDWV